VDKDIEHLMRARYPLIYILSSEEKRVEKSIADVLHAREREKNYKTKIFTWSVTEGVRLGKEPQGDSKDPLRRCASWWRRRPTSGPVFILRDLHAYLKNPEVVRLLRDIGRKLKEELKTVFVISPLLAIPPELDKEVALVEYPLPELLEIDAIFDRVSRNTGAKIPSGQEREHVVEAALGLTADEAEGVFAKSLVQTGGSFDIDVILSEKERIVRKSGVLEFFRTQERMENIGGLDVLKNWLRKRQTASARKRGQFGLPVEGNPHESDSGRGKIAHRQGSGRGLAAAAAAAGRGQDLRRHRRQLRGEHAEGHPVAEAVAPSILWVDELEKGFLRDGIVEQLRRGHRRARVRQLHHLAAGEDQPGVRDRHRQQRRRAASRDDAQGPIRRDLLRRSSHPARTEGHRPPSISSAAGAIRPSSTSTRSPKERRMTGAEIEQAIVSALFDEYDRNGKAGVLTADGVLHSWRRRCRSRGR